MPTTPVRLATAAAIALGLFVVFNANARSINSVDTRVIQHTALAVATTGRADLTQFPDVVASGVRDGYIQIVDGRAVSSYPLLPSLLAAPAYRLALATGAIDADAPRPSQIEAVGALMAAAFVALACALLYLTLAAWRPAAPAAVIALACGLATPLWSSASQALWGHAPAVLLLSLGLAGLLAVPADARRRPAVLLLCGVFVALAVFCRQLLVVFPLGLAVGLWRSTEPRAHSWMFLTGLALGGLTMGLANQLMLGTPLGGFIQLYATGVTVDTHGVSGAWSGDWFRGLAGVLVSPSRGLLVYMPIALLAAVAARRVWREDGLTRYGLVLPTVLYIALWAKYAVWWGGHSFGPRFAADLAVPLALLSAVALTHWASMRSLTRAATVAALVWSVTVQAIGARSYPAGEWNGLPLNVDLTHGRLWDWRDSQLLRTVGSGTYQHYRATLERMKPPLDAEDDEDPVAITDADY